MVFILFGSRNILLFVTQQIVQSDNIINCMYLRRKQMLELEVLMIIEPKMWNNLPPDVTKSAFLPSFKYKLKNHLRY